MPKTYKGKGSWKAHKHLKKSVAQKDARQLRGKGYNAHLETLAGYHFTLFKKKR